MYTKNSLKIHKVQCRRKNLLFINANIQIQHTVNESSWGWENMYMNKIDFQFSHGISIWWLLHHSAAYTFFFSDHTYKSTYMILKMQVYAIIWFWASLSRTIDRRTVDRAQNNSFWKKDKLLIMRYFQIYSFSEEIKKFIYLYLRSAGFLTLYTMIDCKSYCWANFHRILIWIHLICIDYFHQNNAIKFSSTNLISILWITKKMVAEQRSN
jgi:hypothetical protein